MKTWSSMQEVKEANKANGRNWFSPRSMQFFRSRIESGIINYRFFISSEQFEDSQGRRDERRYTVRVVNDNGSIDTLGNFQAYSTKEEAKVAIKKAATDLAVVCALEQLEFCPGEE